MTKRVTVLILGGRITPNLVGVLELEPDVVEFVVSEDTPFRYTEIRKVLEQFTGIEHWGEPQYLSAYDFAANRDACLAAAQGHPAAQVIFDVTSAPKVMGFAGYEVARFLNQRAVIVDTANGRIIDLAHPTTRPVSIEISLKQYLANYGRRLVPTFDFSSLSVERQRAIKAAGYLANTGLAAVEALNGLRSWSQGKGKRTIPFKKTRPLSPEARAVLRKLESFGLITNLQEQDDGRVRYTILNDMDWEYLEGAWLEVFAWDQARRCEDGEGERLLRENDLGFSFEIPSDGARKEIDLGYVYHGQLIHASCKTEARPFKTRYLDELRAVSSLVGGHFASRMFVTNAFLPPETDVDYARFLAQARDRQIVVVTGKDLANIGAILRKQAIDPDYPRI